MLAPLTFVMIFWLHAAMLQTYVYIHKFSMLIKLRSWELITGYFIVASWARVICLICTPKPRAVRPKGVGMHIRANHECMGYNYIIYTMYRLMYYAG